MGRATGGCGDCGQRFGLKTKGRPDKNVVFHHFLNHHFKGHVRDERVFASLPQLSPDPLCFCDDCPPHAAPFKRHSFTGHQLTVHESQNPAAAENARLKCLNSRRQLRKACDECGLQQLFDLSRHISRIHPHLLKRKERARIVCDVCCRDVLRDRFQDHWDSQHGKGKPRPLHGRWLTAKGACDECGLKYPSQRLATHWRRNHLMSYVSTPVDLRKIDCEDCGETRTANNFLHHWLADHADPSPSRQALLANIRANAPRSTKSHRCDECHKIGTKTYIINHFQDHQAFANVLDKISHQKEKMKCDDCEKELDSSFVFYHWLSKHAQSSPSHRRCLEVFRRKVRADVGRRIRVCDHCGKSLSSTKYLMQHLRQHSTASA